MSDGRNLEAHVFVCTNKKEKGECCAAKGAIELREELKKLCQDESKGWHGRVRVNASGCLGRCSEGIAAVVYPQAIWHTKLTKETGAKTIEETLSKILDLTR